MATSIFATGGAPRSSWSILGDGTQAPMEAAWRGRLDRSTASPGEGVGFKGEGVEGKVGRKTAEVWWPEVGQPHHTPPGRAWRGLADASVYRSVWLESFIGQTSNGSEMTPPGSHDPLWGYESFGLPEKTVLPCYTHLLYMNMDTSGLKTQSVPLSFLASCGKSGFPVAAVLILVPKYQNATSWYLWTILLGLPNATTLRCKKWCAAQLL